MHLEDCLFWLPWLQGLLDPCSAHCSVTQTYGFHGFGETDMFDDRETIFLFLALDQLPENEAFICTPQPCFCQVQRSDEAVLWLH